MKVLLLAGAALCALAQRAAFSTPPTPQGAVLKQTELGVMITPLEAGPTLTLEVGSASSFRLGVRFGGWDTAALASPSLDPGKVPAPFSPISWTGWTGIKTTFGSLVGSTDGSGLWALYDSMNMSLVSAGGPPVQNNGTKTLDGGIALPVNGTAALGGSRPCLGNGMFGPPFYYNRLGAYLSFGVSSWLYDPTPANHHCYPVSFSGNIGETSGDMCDPKQQHNNTDVDNPSRSSKYPNGLSNTTLASCCAACVGADDCIAYIWSDGTHPDPNGNCWPLESYGNMKSGAGRLVGVSNSTPNTANAWWAMGGAADWYLAPSANPLAFTKAFYDLTGPAAIPPRCE